MKTQTLERPGRPEAFNRPIELGSSPERERLENVPLVLPLTEFDVNDGDNHRRMVEAELDLLKDSAEYAQQWLDKLNKKSFIGRWMARDAIAYHSSHVERYKTVAQEFDTHEDLVDTRRQENLGEKLAPFLEETYAQNPEAVKEFLAMASPGLEVTDENVQSVIESTDVKQLADTFDRRQRAVEEAGVFIDKNVRAWVDDAVELIKIPENERTDFQKKVVKALKLGVTDPLTGRMNKTGVYNYIDGTKSASEIESQVRALISEVAVAEESEKDRFERFAEKGEIDARLKALKGMIESNASNPVVAEALGRMYSITDEAAHVYDAALQHPDGGDLNRYLSTHDFKKALLYAELKNMMLDDADKRATEDFNSLFLQLQRTSPRPYKGNSDR